jgi:hypothetical protein
LISATSEMAPKGGNAKKESGRAKKAENEAKKQDAAAADKVHLSAPPKRCVRNQLIGVDRQKRRLKSGRMAPRETRLRRKRKPSV